VESGGGERRAETPHKIIPTWGVVLENQNEKSESSSFNTRRAINEDSRVLLESTSIDRAASTSGVV